MGADVDGGRAGWISNHGYLAGQRCKESRPGCGDSSGRRGPAHRPRASVLNCPASRKSSRQTRSHNTGSRFAPTAGSSGRDRGSRHGQRCTATPTDARPWHPFCAPPLDIRRPPHFRSPQSNRNLPPAPNDVIQVCAFFRRHPPLKQTACSFYGPGQPWSASVNTGPTITTPALLVYKTLNHPRQPHHVCT